MNVLSLFSGIGGLELGLQRAGMTVVGQVEINEFCRRVLAKHWPEVPRHDDVRTAAEWWLGTPVADAECGGQPPRRQGNVPGADQETDRREAPTFDAGDGGRRGNGAASPRRPSGRRPAVDLVCGGFPCQPVSSAGRRLAQEDPRWLWPAFNDVVRQLRPRYVLVENVPGLLARGMGDVLGDLADLGYDAEWDRVPAAFVGAPHIRGRIFVVAYTDRVAVERQRRGWRTAQAGTPEMAHANGPPGDTARTPSGAVFQSRTLQRPGRRGSSAREYWTAEPDVGRVAHGVPARMDRLRALGNAVVPQVAEHVGRLILAADAGRGAAA